jgi:hypothetical protein
MSEVLLNLENVIPIKAYDGKRSKNSTFMNLIYYILSTLYGVNDVRKVIKNDFLKLSPLYEDSDPG